MSASSTTPARSESTPWTLGDRLDSARVSPVRSLAIALRVGLAPTAIVAALALVGAGCGGAPDPAGGASAVRVAVLQNADVADPIELVSSSALGVDLALRRAVERGEIAEGSDLWFVETAGRDPAELLGEVRDVAADPSVIAAVVTPFVDAPDAERAFVEAGVPVFSFSGLGGVPGEPGWHRLVPEAATEAAALDAVAGPDACVAGGGPGFPAVDGQVVPGVPDEVVSAVLAAGCSALVWLGDADGALAVAAAFAEGGDTGLELVLTSAARVDRLPRDGFPSTIGAVAVVPCPSVSVDPATSARRFVHDYQAAHGVPPGLCAAEGYALGQALVEAWTKDPPGPSVPGVLEVPGGARIVHDGAEREAALERVVGVRWLPQASEPSPPGP